MSFSADERERYARHILLKEVGGPGQQKLKAATVAIVGMGGLGAPAALYLAAAGVGALRLIDHDTVALSNLQRQIIFGTGDVGAPKVASAESALLALNPNIDIDTRVTRVDASNAEATLDGADIVLDGTDDFATRFAVNDACHALGITLVSGAVGRWDGQVSTFKSGHTKALLLEQRLPCYRCLVPDTPPDAETCERTGIIGALTGVIGSMMALEAIKEIVGAGESLAGRLLLYDGLAATTRISALKRDPKCGTCAHD
jgi:molybdopterin/thiamine biosynthesis adenylyltransferase